MTSEKCFECDSPLTEEDLSESTEESYLHDYCQACRNEIEVCEGCGEEKHTLDLVAGLCPECIGIS